MKPEHRGSSDLARGLALLAWVAWEIIALTGAGIFLGWALHRWIGAPLLLTVAFGLVGLVAAFWRIYRASKNMENQQ
jgi:F0F1-type ATP synthase assembly protein I